MALMPFVFDLSSTIELVKRVLRRLLTSEESIKMQVRMMATLFENLPSGNRTSSLNAKMAQLSKAVVEELRLIEQISAHNDPESYDQFNFWRKQVFSIWEAYHSDLELAIIQNRHNEKEEEFELTEIAPVGREPICNNCNEFGHLIVQCETNDLRVKAEGAMSEMLGELQVMKSEEDFVGVRRMVMCLRQCERLIGPFWTDRQIQSSVIEAALAKLPANICEVYMARPARKTVRSLLHFLGKVMVGLESYERNKAMIKSPEEKWTFQVEDEEAYTRSL